jgi:hypothetical protein
MDVITGLNQFGINSNKFTLNSKIRSEFDFSFELCWPLLKVKKVKVVPNIPHYLQKKFHIFLRSLSIFPNFLSSSTLNRNSFQINQIIFPIPVGRTHSDPTRDRRP